MSSWAITIHQLRFNTFIISLVQIVKIVSEPTIHDLHDRHNIFNSKTCIRLFDIELPYAQFVTRNHCHALHDFVYLVENVVAKIVCPSGYY